MRARLRTLAIVAMVAVGCAASPPQAVLYPAPLSAVAIDNARTCQAWSIAAITIEAIEVTRRGTRSQQMELDARVIAAEPMALGPRIREHRYLGGEAALEVGDRLLALACRREGRWGTIAFERLGARSPTAAAARLARAVATRLDRGVAPVGAEAKVFELAAREGTSEREGSWILPGKPCRDLVGWTGPILDDECFVHRRGGGRAAVIEVRTECGGDSCSAERWVIAGESAKPFRVPAQAEGSIEVLPSLRHAIADLIDIDRSWGKWTVRLIRIDMSTGTIEPYADCMSPALSPKGRWIVCRNQRGDVLRLPADGGTPVLVHGFAAEHGTASFVPYAVDYPAPVTFPNETEMLVSTHTTSDQPVEERVPWSE